jgi:hypothetical protein
VTLTDTLVAAVTTTMAVTTVVVAYINSSIPAAGYVCSPKLFSMHPS